MQNIERRFITDDIRCMGDAQGCDNSIEGLAIAYNSVSSPGSLPFRERIAPGALARSLKNEDILCCFNHNASLIARSYERKDVKASRHTARVAVPLRLAGHDLRSRSENEHRTTRRLRVLLHVR